MANQESETASRYEFSVLAETLKDVLRRKKITYKELSDRMGMSESGIKKVMSSPDGSIARLSELCSAANIDLFAVMELAWKAPPKPLIFTEEQDAFFADNEHYFHFFAELHGAKGDPEVVRNNHDLDAVSIERYVGKLEDLGLLKVMTDGRVRFATHVTDRMRPGPKMKQRFPPQVQHHLIDYIHEHAVTRPGPVFPGTLFVTASMRMTRERLSTLNRAMHEALMRIGTDAMQDELSTPENELVETGVLLVSGEADLSRFYNVPRLERRDD